MLSNRELARLVVVARSDSQDPQSANAAFNRIVLAFQDYAVGAAYGYLRDFGAAQDAAQEAFLAAWRTLPALRDPLLFPAWFKRILASRCYRILRAHRGCDDSSEAVATAPDIEELLNKRERERLVQEALQSLPPPQRLVISLFYFGGENHDSIAKFLGVPRTTVVKRVHAAKQKLKAMLEPLRLAIAKRRPSRTARFASLVRAGIYDDYVGTYQYVGRPELTVAVRRLGNRLVSFSANGQRNKVLLGGRLTQLQTAEYDGAAHFHRNRQGHITHFVYYEFGKRMGIAKKVSGA